jgi:osmotically-inducible protein OsmY
MRTPPTQTPAAPGAASAPETPASQERTPAVSDADLQTQIQNALTKEPTLSADALQVNVTDQNIELSGKVESAREKQTALRIVQSYAANKKVVNHINVGTQSASPSQTERPPDHP